MKLDGVGMISGGFDPIHVGHIQYIQEASVNCNILVAVVNGDSFLERKKGYSFMTAQERAYIIDNVKGVDYTVIYESDQDTVNEMIEIIKPDYFFKGGDRNSPENIPEWDTCIKNHCIVFTNIGGEKIQSSSNLVNRVK